MPSLPLFFTFPFPECGTNAASAKHYSFMILLKYASASAALMFSNRE